MQAVYFHGKCKGTNSVPFSSTETPISLLCCHYQDLLQSLHPTVVANEMLQAHLLNNRWYNLIMNVPCDYIRNKMILEYIRQKETSCLFVFLDILRRSDDHQQVYNILIKGMIVCLYCCISNAR